MCGGYFGIMYMKGEEGWKKKGGGGGGNSKEKRKSVKLECE